MKLIEILVKAKIKFPDGANEAVQDGSGTVKFFDSFNLAFDGNSFWRGSARSGFYCIPINNIIGLALASDYQTSIVTRDEYEAALAASKEMLVNKPVAWDGQGLPPVGCTCEYSLNNGRTWHECKVDYLVGSQGAVLSCDVFEGVQYVHFSNYDGEIFRPLRTEAERKRDDIEKAINEAVDASGTLGHVLYDAIAAGNIPGVKLEAPDA